MNSFIETLNQWGGSFLGFAWPMLWQSGLLIVVLFMLDFLLRHRLRASIRYALWLVVLVKLCLPPTLALPTSPAWWLHQAPPPAAAEAEVRYTVTYDNAPLPELPPAPLPAYVPPNPVMNFAAWLLIVSTLTSLTLFCWMLIRWWQVTRQVRQAKTCERLVALAAEAQIVVGIKAKVPVKLTVNAMSPAVCGLFRPAILVPQSLAENFSDEQLRAVLLHELIHLRRRDVWVNFLQALLQILYWWHPLVWLANARIRRVREEAVDDAVMLALRDGAEAYAPTLLEVAKLALNRPLASLGLVGILESRHALRQRIERLLDFSPPRRAGLTLVSLLGILAFTAVAVPMGEGPAPAEKQSAPIIGGMDAVGEQSLTVKVNPEIFIRNAKAQAGKYLLAPTNNYTDILLAALRSEGVDSNPPHGLAFNTKTGEITTQNKPNKLEVFRQVMEQLNRADGKCELPLRASSFHRQGVLLQARIYQLRAADFEKITTGLKRYSGGPGGDPWWSVAPDKIDQLIGGMESSGLQPILRPRILASSGSRAQFYVGNGTNSVEFDCLPIAAEGFVDVTLQGTAIDVATVGAGVTNHFNSRASAQDHGGIVVRVENYAGHAGEDLVTLLNVEIVTNDTRFHPRLQALQNSNADPTTITGVLSNSNFNVALHALQQRQGFDSLAEPEVTTISGPGNNQMTPDSISVSLSGAYATTANPIAVNTNSVQAVNAEAGVLGRQNLLKKLNRIRFDQFGPFAGLSLGEVVGKLVKATGISMSEESGLNINQPVNLPWPLKNISALDALDAVILHVDQPIKYSIWDDGVIFSLADQTPVLFSRTFRVDARTFIAALRKQTGLQSTNASAMARSFFSRLGVDLESPKGKSVYFNETRGVLFVKATEADLDTIERAIPVLNQVPPQVHIKARFVEVTRNTSGAAGVDWYLGQLNASNNVSGNGGSAPAPNPPGVFPGTATASAGSPPNSTPAVAQVTGILTDSNFHVVLHALENRPGVEILAEPEVTTTSGRQTQMRATEVVTVITNLVFQDTFTNQDGTVVTSAIVPQTSKLETGPILDVVPYVLADGDTINLTLIPSLTEFLGYDTPTNTTTAYNRAGEKIDVPKVLPRFTVRQAVTTLNLWDNQTAVIRGLPEATYVGGSVVAGNLKANNKELLVFITATMVDPAGNRIHSDYYDLMSAQKGAPPQPPPAK